MTGREEIEQAIRLAGPIYDDAGAIDAIESIIRKRAAAELRGMAEQLGAPPTIAEQGLLRRTWANRLRARADHLDPS